MFLQSTIKKSVEVRGIGLHTGRECALFFRPAPADTGVHFVRADLPGKPSLKVFATSVQATTNATVLGGEQFSVSTVEHCLSALAALRIDNLIIELEGPEIPIIDGSAKDFLTALLGVGLVEQDQPRKYVYITRPIELEDNGKTAKVLPYNGLRITCEIDFSHPIIGHQLIDLDINEQTFTREIAHARTFGFLKDVEALQSKGLALGGSLQNAIVLSEDGMLNSDPLRFKDEFVRHKVLDALGDLVTLGNPMMGHLILYKAGHDVMNKLVRKILESKDCYRLVELGSETSSGVEQ